MNRIHSNFCICSACLYRNVFNSLHTSKSMNVSGISDQWRQACRVVCLETKGRAVWQPGAGVGRCSVILV